MLTRWPSSSNHTPSLSGKYAVRSPFQRTRRIVPILTRDFSSLEPKRAGMWIQASGYVKEVRLTSGGMISAKKSRYPGTCRISTNTASGVPGNGSARSSHSIWHGTTRTRRALDWSRCCLIAWEVSMDSFEILSGGGRLRTCRSIQA